MEVTEHLKKEGFVFTEFGGYDLVKRVHIIHYLFWSEQLKHFAIGVINDKGKAGGGKDKFHIIALPKPIYDTKQADDLINSITTK